MTYRAAPVTQRDGSALASSNCRMASIATGLDFHTRGTETSSGAAMRGMQSDQSGGTDSGDAAEAWAAYGQELRVRDGETFDAALADLLDGRLVHLDVWAAACAGPCCDSECGHTIAVAPEQSGTRWLTSDPWCSPAKWVWWEEALLREGAETWGGMCYSGATAGRARPADQAVLIALMRLAARRLMSAWLPDRPALRRPEVDTAGANGRIMFTTTASHAEQAPTAEDVMFNVGPTTTHRDAIVKGCAELYSDSALTVRHSATSADTALGFLGSTETAHVVVNAGNTNYVRREDVLDIVVNDRTYE